MPRSNLEMVPRAEEPTPAEQPRSPRSESEREPSPATALETMAVRAQLADLLTSDARKQEMRTIAAEFSGPAVRELLDGMVAEDPALAERLKQEGLRDASGAWNVESPLYTAIIEPITQSLAVRMDGLAKGQTDHVQFADGLRRQIRNLVAGFRKGDAPQYPKLQPRPINYGRPGVQPPAAKPSEQPPTELPEAA